MPYEPHAIPPHAHRPRLFNVTACNANRTLIHRTSTRLHYHDRPHQGEVGLLPPRCLHATRTARYLAACYAKRTLSRHMLSRRTSTSLRRNSGSHQGEVGLLPPIFLRLSPEASAADAIAVCTSPRLDIGRPAYLDRARIRSLFRSRTK